jgi:hypothetical protein
MPPTVGLEGFISRKMKRLVAWQANQFCIAGEGLQIPIAMPRSAAASKPFKI